VKMENLEAAIDRVMATSGVSDTSRTLSLTPRLARWLATALERQTASAVFLILGNR